MASETRIGLIGYFNQQQKAHGAIPKALAAASAQGVWVPTDSIGRGESLAQFDGLWCVPGMPYRSAEGAVLAIQFARTSRTPFLATSAGFQYALIEYARNALGLIGAEHQRANPQAAMPFISLLDAALAGVKARVRFTAGSKLRQAYGAGESVEQYHCSYGLNGRYRRLMEGRDLLVTAVDDQDEIRAVELDGHPFYVATLFQPEMRTPSPLVNAFVGVCERLRRGVTKAAI